MCTVFDQDWKLSSFRNSQNDGSFFLFQNGVYFFCSRSVSLFLYIVLGALNRHLPWDMTLTHPAANTLLLHVQVLYVRAGIVSQQSRTIVWFGNQARIHT